MTDRHNCSSLRTLTVAAALAAFTVDSALAQQVQSAAESSSSSLMVNVETAAPSSSVNQYEPHALRTVSMFAIAPAEARIFHEHDLLQIIVRETSSAASTHEMDTKKITDLKIDVSEWPNFQLADLIQGVIVPSDVSGLAQLDMSTQKKFVGDGEYKRRDDFTARLTAEIVEILPNGNLIVESRTRIKTDSEEQILKVTGICRPEDVTPANTVLSSQLHDLKIEKMHKGELKDATEPGIFTKILNTLFAF